MSFWKSLLGRDETDDTPDDLIGERRQPTEPKKPKDKSKNGKGPTPPVRREVYSGRSLFYEVARKETEDNELWLVEAYRAKLSTDLGDDSAADVDDVINSRLKAGTIKLVVKYLDSEGCPVRTVDVPQALAEADLADYKRQNDEADAEFKQAMAEYKAKKSGQPAPAEKPSDKEEAFVLTEDILAMLAELSLEEKTAFMAETPGITPLDRVKILSAKPKKPAEGAPADG